MSDMLSGTLENVAELYAAKERLDKELRDVKSRIAAAEKIAVEQLAASGLDGVRAAGKSWYLRDFWSVSIPNDKKEEAIEAARRAGLDDYVTVNTASLKSWLVDRFKNGGASSESLAAGTEFDGIVSEYHEMRLSRQTL